MQMLNARIGVRSEQVAFLKKLLKNVSIEVVAAFEEISLSRVVFFSL